MNKEKAERRFNGELTARPNVDNEMAQERLNAGLKHREDLVRKMRAEKNEEAKHKMIDQLAELNVIIDGWRKNTVSYINQHEKLRQRAYLRGVSRFKHGEEWFDVNS